MVQAHPHFLPTYPGTWGFPKAVLSSGPMPLPGRGGCGTDFASIASGPGQAWGSDVARDNLWL